MTVHQQQNSQTHSCMKLRNVFLCYYKGLKAVDTVLFKPFVINMCFIHRNEQVDQKLTLMQSYKLQTTSKWCPAVQKAVEAVSVQYQE